MMYKLETFDTFANTFLKVYLLDTGDPNFTLFEVWRSPFHGMKRGEVVKWEGDKIRTCHGFEYSVDVATELTEAEEAKVRAIKFYAIRLGS